MTQISTWCDICKIRHWYPWFSNEDGKTLYNDGTVKTVDKKKLRLCKECHEKDKAEWKKVK